MSLVTRKKTANPEAARSRSVHGILLLDKPVGLSSNRALQIVKRLFGARKAGHTGSLDPLASGMLPICLGEATKFSGFLLNADKSYRFVCQLGVDTSTGDAEGEVVRTRSVGSLLPADIESILRRFTGRIRQVPPMYSAVKHQGRRLYELARRGIEIERQPREVVIYDLRLLGLEGKDCLELEVRCSKGTYVRTLAEDIGEALGCGAHVVALRRIEVTPYGASQMVTLEDLQRQAEAGSSALDALLLPIDTPIAAWPAVRVRDDMAYYLSRGQPVLVPRAPTRGWVRLYRGDAERFFGMGEILDDGRIAPRRLVQQ